MKILYLGPFPPPHGGVQTNLVDLRDYARSQGHDASVINLTRHRRENADQVYYPQTAQETAALILKSDADLIHLHIGGNLGLRMLGLCLFCGWAPGKKSVMTFHSGGWPTSPEGRATTRNSFPGFALRSLDGLIAVNEEIRQFFLKCGVPDERIRLIAPHSSNKVPGELTGKVKEFFEAHSPLLLCVCGLEPEYDVALQIRTMGRVLEKHPNAGLLIAGSGSLQAQIRAQIDATPYADHILLAGDVPHESTLRAIQDSSIMLRTTHYDGDAISVREALAMGTPVIATRTAFRPEGCHLIPCPPQDDDLVACIDRVLALPPTARRAPSSKANVKNLAEVIDFYQELLKR